MQQTKLGGRTSRTRPVWGTPMGLAFDGIYPIPHGGRCRVRCYFPDLGGKAHGDAPVILLRAAEARMGGLESKAGRCRRLDGRYRGAVKVGEYERSDWRPNVRTALSAFREACRLRGPRLP